MVRLAPFALALAALLVIAAPAGAAGAPRGPVTHTVYPGQTLGKIAKRYNVSIDDLCRQNRIRRNSPIKPGQKLVIPDGKVYPTPQARKAARWQDYAGKPYKRGYIVLESPGKRWRGYVISPKGNVLPRAKESIERMLASWRTGKRHAIDRRLILLIAKVSDTFGGRPIRVVSGYRERSLAAESKHKVGRALDFSIPGVPNALVRDYLRTLSRVGVGYYPNSTHVHLDVRDRTTYWIDHSRPGQGHVHDEETEPGDDATDSAPGIARAEDDPAETPPVATTD